MIMMVVAVLFVIQDGYLWSVWFLGFSFWFLLMDIAEQLKYMRQANERKKCLIRGFDLGTVTAFHNGNPIRELQVTLYEDDANEPPVLTFNFREICYRFTKQFVKNIWENCADKDSNFFLDPTGQDFGVEGPVYITGKDMVDLVERGVNVWKMELPDI